MKISFFFFLLIGPLCSCGVEHIQSDIRKVQSGVSDLRSFQAEQTTKISALETEMRQLAGRVEELEYAQKQKLGVDLNELKGDISELRRRVPPPAVVPALALEADESAVDRMPPEAAPIFRAAFQALREGKFADAEEHLKEARQLTHGTQWSADALFWLGVSREGAGRSREALQAYHTVVADFSKHRKAPAALLREAGVFDRLGDSKTAKATLRKLVADYPKSEEAARGRQRLKDL